MPPTKQAQGTVLPTAAMVMIIAINGCESRDERLADYAQQVVQQQARQNERAADQSQAVARQSHELASAAHQLVDQDAAARREMIEAHGQLQQQIFQERSGVDRQREQLDIERKSVLAASLREPVIAQAIIAGALIWPLCCHC
jgi:sensor c-di-GMP phosphodiesterase-like protein